MMTGTTAVQMLKGVGEARAKAFAKLGLTTVQELVSCYPRRYEDRRSLLMLRELIPGEFACFEAMVASLPRHSRIRRGLDLIKFRAVDDSDFIEITYFNQPYLKDKFVPGRRYHFYGRIEGTLGRFTVTNPEFEEADSSGGVTGQILPVYPLTAGLSQKTVRNVMRQGLQALDTMPDALPERIRSRCGLWTWERACRAVHFPESYEELAEARKRLIFEEFFVLSCAMQCLRTGREEGASAALHSVDFSEFFESLPFAPTNAQRRAVSEAAADMQSGRPMSRLLQGDVGSGKTLVAAALAWFVWKNGHQSAFMAPTEILAEQHLETMRGFLEPLGMRVGCLTGSQSAAVRRTEREKLLSGETDLLVGTHALLSEEVRWRDLKLVITDEQHRFGVAQRSALSEKGEQVHILVMSATPIPRTLAMMVYGELDLSVLDEKPPGRQKIDTFAVGEAMRPRIQAFIRKLVGEGRQVFIVCPMIEENEDYDPDLKSAESYALELQETVFPDLRIACVHGKMKAKDKDAVMAAFVRGETDVLVSTTVIEVGVDVPNAALMIVENAERFGLSQLHQLRGRVGRGTHKSYCVLFSESQSRDTRERLKVMCQTNDGFVIAEEDLKLRGPGDFFGARQHGLPELKIADLCTDIDLMEQAKTASAALLQSDPQLKRAENRHLREKVLTLLQNRGV